MELAVIFCLPWCISKLRPCKPCLPPVSSHVPAAVPGSTSLSPYLCPVSPSRITAAHVFLSLISSAALKFSILVPVAHANPHEPPSPAPRTRVRQLVSLSPVPASGSGPHLFHSMCLQHIPSLKTESLSLRC